VRNQHIPESEDANMNPTLLLLFIICQLFVEVMSLKPQKIGEMERSKSKIANWSPLAKLCFKCDPGTVSNGTIFILVLCIRIIVTCS
jgi:hypothetical protein